MNKKELIDAMSSKSGFTKKDSEILLQSFMDVVEKTLSNGDKIKLVGFGTFETRERAERVGRNPKTNEEIQIPARRVPHFKVAEVFKKRISDKLK